ncbi:MAG: hypothetical protein WD378_03955, partial [Egicoccus sp.]
AQVVVDRSASMSGDKRLLADQLAAGLSVLGARDGVRLWLVDHDRDQGGDRITGGWARGSGALAHAGLLLAGTGEATADAAASAGDDDAPAGRPDLTLAVGRAVRAPARGPLVLVSDLLYDDWDATVRTLGSGNRDVLVLQVLDVEELRPHLVDDVRVVDAETGDEIEVGGDDHTTAAYAAALHAHLAAVEQVCLSIGAAHLLVPTDTDLSRLLLADLAALGLVS